MAQRQEFPIPVPGNGSPEYRVPDDLNRPQDFRPPVPTLETTQADSTETMAPVEPDAMALKALAHVRENELSPHALTGDERTKKAAEVLATFGNKEGRIYMDAEIPPPGRYRRDYRPRRKTERQLDTLRDNATKALENIDEFRDASRAKRLGSMVLRAFEPVIEIGFKDSHVADTKVKRKKVHNPETGKKERKEVVVDGVSTIGRTEFFVTTETEARTLHGALSALSRTDRIHDAHYVTPPIKDKDGRWMVSLSNLDEYDSRIMETAIARHVIEEDFADGVIGTTLPQPKMTQAAAKKRGITHHPQKQARIDRAQRQYETIRVNMKAPTYREGMPDHEDTLAAMDRKPEVLTSSPSAVFEVIRKHHNANMKHIRGDGSRNQEQHPDREQRLLIEKNVRLKRAIGKPGQADPPEVRAIKSRESIYENSQAVVKKQRKNPVTAAIKLVGKATGVGVTDLTLQGIAELGPRIKRAAKNRREDKKAYRAEQERAKASVKKTAKRIDQIIDHYSDRK